MTHLDLFIGKMFDRAEIDRLLIRAQECFKKYKMAVFEVIWNQYPNGYYYVERLGDRDPKQYKKIEDVPQYKFLVFEDFPTGEVFVEKINAQLVRWVIDHNWKKVDVYPVWKLSDSVKK